MRNKLERSYVTGLFLLFSFFHDPFGFKVFSYYTDCRVLIRCFVHIDGCTIFLLLFLTCVGNRLCTQYFDAFSNIGSIYENLKMLIENLPLILVLQKLV